MAVQYWQTISIATLQGVFAPQSKTTHPGLARRKVEANTLICGNVLGMRHISHTITGIKATETLINWFLHCFRVNFNMQNIEVRL